MSRITELENKVEMLFSIINGLYTSMAIGIKAPDGWIDSIKGNLSPYFEFNLQNNAKQGDIVKMGTSNRLHRWSIARYIEHLGANEHLVEELGGSGKRCRFYNERIEVLRGMPESFFYYGHKRKVFLWASKTVFMERYAGYFDRCGGVTMTDDTLTINVRPHCWIAGCCEPYNITMPWSDKTRLKDILSAMKMQGFPRFSK